VRAAVLGEPGGQRVEALVDLVVDAADEEARHARHPVDGLPGGRALLERVEVRLHHAAVRVDAEEERDVHVDAVGEERAHGARAALGARHLDHHVRPADRLPQAPSLGHGRVGIVRHARRHLDRHVAVDAGRALVRLEERVARGAHVVRLHQLEQLPRGARTVSATASASCASYAVPSAAPSRRSSGWTSSR
jgi:hypothetical protein